MAASAGFAGYLWRLLVSRETAQVRLARHTFWSIAGSASAQGSALLAAVVVARTIGVTGFGKFTLIQATVLLMSTLGELGLALTVTKFVSRWREAAPERSGQLVGWSLRITAVSAIIMGALMASLAPLIQASSVAGLSCAIWAACGLLFFEMLNRVQLGSLAGLEAFETVARVQMCRGFLLLPCVWLGARFGGLPGAILAAAFVSLVTFVIGHQALRNKCRSHAIPLHYNGRFDREVFSTSMALWGSTLLLAATTWFVAVMLSRQADGLSELALYKAAEKWKTALLFLPQTLFQVTLPMLSHSHGACDYRACSRIFSTALVSTVAVTSLGASLILLFSRHLMSYYGEGFGAGAAVLSLAAPVAVVSAIYTVGSSALWALGKSIQMLCIDLLKALLLLGLCLLGYATTAWNLMFAYLLTFSGCSIIVMLAVRRHLGLHRRQ